MKKKLMNKVVNLMISIGQLGSKDSSIFLTNNFRNKELIKTNR